MLAIIAALLIAPARAPKELPRTPDSGPIQSLETSDPDVVALEKLGRHGFEPALTLLMKTCVQLEGQLGRLDQDRLYRKYNDLIILLGFIATPHDSSQLSHELASMGKYSRYRKEALFTLLAKVGDPRIVTPAFSKGT